VERLKKIKLVAMDVDGVLTDCGMCYIEGAGQAKVFNAQDGLGIRLAMAAGLKIAIVTGNRSPAVARRAEDLGVKDLYQGARYKSEAIRVLIKRHNLTPDEVAYVGDDLNDLPAFDVAGVSFAVGNAVADVKQAADFVTEKLGGSGADREAIELILKSQGRWQEAVAVFLSELEREQADGRVAGAIG
jgi:3-deoxy-D-manno-octulosonate 8-phosphate phosphatase (KDO 8-P phosphatase)